MPRSILRTRLLTALCTLATLFSLAAPATSAHAEEAPVSNLSVFEMSSDSETGTFGFRLDFDSPWPRAVFALRAQPGLRPPTWTEGTELKRQRGRPYVSDLATGQSWSFSLWVLTQEGEPYQEPGTLTLRGTRVKDLATPNKPVKGLSGKMTGVLVDTDTGKPVPGYPVQTDEFYPDGEVRKSAGGFTTDKRGRFTETLQPRPGVRYRFRVRFDRLSQVGLVPDSAWLRVPPTATTTRPLRVAPEFAYTGDTSFIVAKGRKARITFTTSPELPGTKVTVYARVGRTWKVAARSRFNRDGEATAAVVPHTTGRVCWQVRTPRVGFVAAARENLCLLVT